MNAEDIREYCIALPEVTEEFPFDDETLVFKVGGKIFMLLPLEGELSLNLKCDPDVALQLREQYAAVRPGYHMNKKHWNTVDIDGTIPEQEIYRMIDHSYQLVRKKLPGKRRK